jgi:hypothetical protein
VSDYRDVMAAEAEADRAQNALQVYGGNVEDSAADDRTVALAVCLAADALCARIHALGQRLDYLAHEVQRGR